MNKRKVFVVGEHQNVALSIIKYNFCGFFCKTEISHQTFIQVLTLQEHKLEVELMGRHLPWCVLSDHLLRFFIPIIFIRVQICYFRIRKKRIDLKLFIWLVNFFILVKLSDSYSCDTCNKHCTSSNEKASQPRTSAALFGEFCPYSRLAFMMSSALVFNYAFSDSGPELAAIALRIAAWVNSEVPSVGLNSLASRVDPVFLVAIGISMEHPLVIISRVAGAATILFSTVRIIIVI
jgi:hypothetical protein